MSSTRRQSYEWLHSILLPVLVFVTAIGCTESPPGEGKPEPLRLPEACYGTWELISTGGGIAGTVNTDGAGTRMVIREDHVIESRSASGQRAERRFTVKQGRSIFSADESFFIVYVDDPLDLVVQLTSDGTGMSLSQNVCDGFGTSYRRVED